jgi:hypothetical protein
MATFEWRFRKVPHAQRVALRQVMLRGAAREYVENANSPAEEFAAAELCEAAVQYAVTLLQRAGAEAAPSSQGRRKNADTTKEAR